jgi:hypothetical protein
MIHGHLENVLRLVDIAENLISQSISFIRCLKPGLEFHPINII